MDRGRVFRRLSQCVGLASLVLVLNYGEMLGGGRDVRMHVPLPLTGIAFAQIADILLLGLVLFAVLAPLRETRLWPWVESLLAIGIPPYLLSRNYTLFPVMWLAGLIPVLTVIWAATLLLLLIVFPRTYRRLMRLGDFAGVFLAFFAVSSILQILWTTLWRPLPQQYSAAWTRTTQTPRTHPLIVWIIFDELSYDQVFEHRARDLALPNFDALRSQSTLFTDVQPIGLKTVKIIPSLLTGQVVDDFAFTLQNRFRVHYDGQRGWHALDGSQTIFADAQKNGWRTAAVGWYNPYCTIYADALDTCYWTDWDKIDGPMAQRKSFWMNTFTPLQQVVREVKSRARAEHDLCSYDVRQRYETHVDLESHALELLKTDQADFVYLHLAIPHSPNIWSRADGDYTQWCDSSYLDNLALADLELGRVMRVLAGSPRWKDTTLIVEGDHSWRVQLWDWLPAWTEEDDHASKDTFDTRPALLIHEAGQTRGTKVMEPWSLLRVHAVLEELVRGEPVRR